MRMADATAYAQCQNKCQRFVGEDRLDRTDLALPLAPEVSIRRHRGLPSSLSESFEHTSALASEHAHENGPRRAAHLSKIASWFVYPATKGSASTRVRGV